MGDTLMARVKGGVKKMLGAGGDEGLLTARDEAALRKDLKECAAGLGGEVANRARAERLAHRYRALRDEGRLTFLRMIASEFRPDPAAVAEAHAQFQAAVGTDRYWEAEGALRAALRSRRLRILTQFNAFSGGVKFLVDLRGDLLRFMKDDPALMSLDRELESRLAAWFDVGFLELQRITWTSPAAMLEKLMGYEAVHEIRGWNDLRNRLDSDRRCYAFFHPAMPMEPLIFVEVALVQQLAGNVQQLLDERAPLFDSTQANTAIFYSINNTQAGLRGVSFGNFLLKRVLDRLQRDHPHIQTFATLSPLPKFRAWAERNAGAWEQAFPASQVQKVARHAPVASAVDIRKLLEDPAWATHPALAKALAPGLTSLAALYLTQARSGSRPYDPVARFHLGNGARIERLNMLGDTSPNGLKQSYGMMVNYLYDPEALADNFEALTTAGTIAQSPAVRKAAKA